MPASLRGILPSVPARFATKPDPAARQRELLRQWYADFTQTIRQLEKDQTAILNRIRLRRDQATAADLLRKLQQ